MNKSIYTAEANQGNIYSYEGQKLGGLTFEGGGGGGGAGEGGMQKCV